MINLKEGTFSYLLNEAKGLGLEFEIKKENELIINISYLDDFLQILLKVCFEKKNCFNILRKELDFLIIEIFSLEGISTLFIEVKYSTDITKEKKVYQKVFNKYKNRKIFPIIGPDGVGKTTLLTSSIDIKKKNILYLRFKKIVRRSVLYNLVYPFNKFFLKRKLGVKPEKDQHDDIHYLLVLFSGLFYYPYLIFNSKFRKKEVFVDRFFNDYLLENISFLDKKTTLRKNWKKLLSLLPKVFWAIQLDADAHIILNRKQELTVDDIEKYRNLNFKIYLSKPAFMYTYINTELELEKCKLFLEHCYKKALEK